MKKKTAVYIIITMTLLFFVISGCKGKTDNTEGTEKNETIKKTEKIESLEVPQNVKIEVIGRLMTVSWDAAEKAEAYEITTASTGCGSGNRIINTKTKTVTNHSGTVTKSGTSETPITDEGNGFVTFTGNTSFVILLMPETPGTEVPMATQVSAKVKALAEDSEKDSAYSEETILNKTEYLP